MEILVHFFFVATAHCFLFGVLLRERFFFLRSFSGISRIEEIWIGKTYG